MIIAALDLSTCTGVSIWNRADKVPMTNFAIEMDDAPTGHYDEGDLDVRLSGLGYEIVRIRKEYEPDLWVMEAAQMYSGRGGGEIGFIITQRLHGIVCSHLQTMKCLRASMAPSTWRKHAYQNGNKQQKVIPDCDRHGEQKRDKKTGALLWKKEDWGKIAVAQCKAQKIPLPNLSQDKLHNVAEAALIAMMWKHSKCHGQEYLDRFTQLKLNN